MVTIKNDVSGCVLGTQILNEEGVDICGMMGVIAIEISMPSVNEIVKATLTIGLVKTEVTAGEIDWIAMNPQSGTYEKVANITFASGARLNFDSDGTFHHYPNRGVTTVLTISDGRARKFKSPKTGVEI